MRGLFPAILVGVMTVPAIAQQQPALQVVPVSAVPVLPRNTQVLLALNETLSTRSKRQKQGDTFTLTVAQNVVFRGYVVIPRGARATGHISWQTRKGAFGKSGKMELAFDYIEIGDLRIPIEGRHREEGEGNSSATVATALFLSVLGSGFITGHSAELPAGHQFAVWTSEDTPVNLPGDAPAAIMPQGVVVAQRLEAVPVAVKKPMPAPAAAPAFGNGKVRCLTCRY